MPVSENTCKPTDWNAPGTCKVCGAHHPFVHRADKICIHCQSHHCYRGPAYRGILCHCDFQKDKRVMYTPCFQYPICLAIRNGDPNWRQVQPLDAVPYSPQPGGLAKPYQERKVDINV